MARLKGPSRCSGRLVPARRQPSSRSPVPGAGARAAGGTGPASPRSGGCRTPGSRARPPGFYPRALGVGCAAGRRVPPLRALPPAGSSSQAEGGSRRGAGRGARGAGRDDSAANRSGPSAARLPPPALPGAREPGARGRGGGPRVRTRSPTAANCVRLSAPEPAGVGVLGG